MSRRRSEDRMRILGIALVYVILAGKATSELPKGTRMGCFMGPQQLLQHLNFVRPELKDTIYEGINPTGPKSFVAKWVDVVPSGERQYQLHYHLESCGKSQKEIVVDEFYPVYLFHTRAKR